MLFPVPKEPSSLRLVPWRAPARIGAQVVHLGAWAA